MSKRAYYEAYDARYQSVHAQGLSWFTDSPSPIVAEIMDLFQICPQHSILELGCGEGRDANPLLQHGYDVLATDISPEAIRNCQEKWPDFANSFSVLDCVHGDLPKKFDFIYAMALVHMLVDDQDRDAFYRFVGRHLSSDGVALICAMGDGNIQMRSSPDIAFTLQNRNCHGKDMLVAATSCAMVNYETFVGEIRRNGLQLVKLGNTSVPNEFPRMMYGVVKIGSPDSELADILRIHALRYPLMQPQDGVKLIYQNEFGGGHLIADPDRAIAYLHREYAQIEKNSEFVAEESIGNGIYRIHLQSLNREDVEELGQAFLASAKTHTGSMEVFLEKLEILRRLTGENAFCFSLEELDEYLTEYKKAGYPMVSHSEAYRNAYHPAYRIVKK